MSISTQKKSKTHDVLIKAAQTLYTPEVPQELRNELERDLCNLATQYNVKLANYLTLQMEQPSTSSSPPPPNTDSATTRILTSLQEFNVRNVFNVCSSQFQLQAPTACMFLSTAVLYFWLQYLTKQTTANGEVVNPLYNMDAWHALITTRALPVYRKWVIINGYKQPHILELLKFDAWQAEFSPSNWELVCEQGAVANLTNITSALRSVHQQHETNINDPTWLRGISFTHGGTSVSLIFYRKLKAGAIILFDSHGWLVPNACGVCFFLFYEYENVARLLQQIFVRTNIDDSADEISTTTTTFGESATNNCFSIAVFKPKVYLFV